MLRRFIRDESGIAMGLAVIVVVLVGVMGAGLLVFVRNDLQAVVQVNQGQQAFDAADAGVQAAKRHLLSDADSESYDGDDVEDSEWSYDEDDAADRKQLTFDGKTVDVTIEYLEPASNETETETEGFTPEIIDADDNRRFFRVESTGNSESGAARRKVEAIYNTYDLGVPEAYYTPGDIEISGSACIENVSLFTLGSVDFNGGGGCEDDAGNNIGHMKGEDLAYGDWKNSYNETARENAAGTPVTDAGIGAAGAITDSTSLGTRDYDSTTNPAFLDTPSDPQESDEITFPFNQDSQSGDADEDRINFLRDEAMRQESEMGEAHYYDLAGGGTESLTDWPTDSTDETVVFVEFDSATTLKWSVAGDCDDPPKKGTLVVKGGNFTTQPNKALFRGVVMVRGGEVDDGSSDDTGNTCLEGFINASGPIKIAGEVQPFASEAVTDRPGFYGVETWSWRELYE